MVAVEGARISRRRRSPDQAAARQGIARRRSPRGWSLAPSWPTRRSARRCGTAARRRSTASTDPMIVYARSIDANDRAIQKRFDDEVDAPLTAAQAKLADARFAAYGDTRLSRCDLHAAHQLRQGRRLDRARPAGPDPHRDGRHVRPRDRRRAVRPAARFRRQPRAGSTARPPMTSSPPTTSSAAIRARR